MAGETEAGSEVTNEKKNKALTQWAHYNLSGPREHANTSSIWLDFQLFPIQDINRCQVGRMHECIGMVEVARRALQEAKPYIYQRHPAVLL